MKKLPVLASPLFETVLPVSGEKIQYRSYTIKEEKIMLVAKQSEDPALAISSVEQVLRNCTLGEVDVEKLNIVDFTWLLIEIRSKSVNDKIFIQFLDDETDEEIKAEITTSSAEIVKKENGHDGKITIENYTLFLKYPGFKVFRMLVNNPEDPEAAFKTISSSLDKIVAGDEVMYFKDFSEQDIYEFMDSLPDTVSKDIKEFYDGMPNIKHVIKYTRPSDKKERSLTIEGFDAFFT